MLQALLAGSYADVLTSNIYWFIDEVPVARKAPEQTAISSTCTDAIMGGPSPMMTARSSDSQGPPHPFTAPA